MEEKQREVDRKMAGMTGNQLKMKEVVKKP